MLKASNAAADRMHRPRFFFTRQGAEGAACVPATAAVCWSHTAGLRMKSVDEAFLTSILDLMLDAVCVVDSESRFVFVSAACERIFGYAPAEMIGQPMLSFVHPDDRARTLQAVDEIVSQAPKPHFENRYLHKDGHAVHVMWSARWSADHRVRVAVARDVTALRRAESRQQALYAVSEAVYSASSLPALFERVHEIVRGELASGHVAILLHDEALGRLVVAYPPGEPEPEPEVEALGRESMLAPGVLLRAHGEHEWLGVPLQGAHAVVGVLLARGAKACVPTERDVELVQFVATQLAVAIDRHDAAASLQRAARHDPLTDLPNRLLLGERLQTALIRARQDQTQLSVLYLDLDLFKQVNDRLGHAIGDLLLQETARRLKACVRDSDTVARIGGDEFVVLLCHLRATEHALIVAEKIREALSRPYELGDSVTISPSIGVANFPEHGESEAELLHHADESMYLAKRNGGNRFWLSAGAPSGSTSAAVDTALRSPRIPPA